MSQYEEKDGEGAAFYQSKKKNERAPDWTGKFKLNGKELELALWERKSKSNNTPYLRFVIKERFVPYQARQQTPPRQMAAPSQPEPNDDIPF